MRLFYYVHTGHRIGLDRFHRAAAIINALGDIDITLLCSDFRIAGEARRYGIKRAVGVDVVRNIPQISHHGDKIIFDSDEANPTLLDDMIQYFSTFIRISDDPLAIKHPKEFLISPYLEGEKIFRGLIVGPQYSKNTPKSIPMALFFGDDDYEKDLQKNQSLFSSYNMDLLMGYYHFLGYENELEKSFKTIHDSEEYDEVICKTDILVTASPMAVMQNLSSGGRPIFIQRLDYPNDFISLFESLNIPVVQGYDKNTLDHALKTLSNVDFHSLEQSNIQMAEFIKKAFYLG